jgi:hypothetical protein
MVSPGGFSVMTRDFFADELPLTGKEAPAGRHVGASVIWVVWLLAVSFFGFSATLAVMWFGPGAAEYVKEFSWPSSPVAQKTGGAPKSNPWNLPEFKPAWDTSKIQVYEPPSIPAWKFPPGHSISAPNAGGGAGFRGFSTHR